MADHFSKKMKSIKQKIIISHGASGKYVYVTLMFEGIRLHATLSYVITCTQLAEMTLDINAHTYTIATIFVTQTHD